MICPACREEMIVVEYKKIELDICVACRGVWCDADALGLLLGTLDLCDRFADGTLRVTTRQGLQLHGVAKGNLWQSIHEISQTTR